MKSLFIFLMVLLLTGCSVSSINYMNHEDIIKRMKEISEKSLEKSSIDSEEMRRKANLIPLEDLFGEDFKKLKEKKNKDKLLMKAAPVEEKMRIGVDYRFRDTPIKNQWNGTCTTFGGVAGIENLLNNPTLTDLSERDSWSKYQEYSSRSFVEHLSLDGNEICREVDWGQNEVYPSDTCTPNRKWRLGNTVYLEDNIEAALDALDRGSVVYIGMSTPIDMLSCSSVIKTDSGFASGGHAILIVGYRTDPTIKGGGYFIIKNSWGADCGDYGYQYLPFYLCQRNDGYCSMWEFQTVVENNITPPEPPKPEYKWVKICKRMWYWLWLKKKCWWVKEQVN